MQSSSATKKQNLLPELSDEDLQESEPVLFLFIGKPGSGKSSFVAQIPNSVFIYHSADHGIIELKRRGLVPKSTFIWEKPFTTVKSLYDQLELVKSAGPASGKHTVVIEGLTGIQTVWTKNAIDLVCNNNAADFHAFGKGVKLLKDRDNYLPKFLRLISELRESGLNVVITGHSADKNDTDSKTGTSIKKATTSFPQTLLDLISGYASFHGVFSKRPAPEKVTGRNIVKVGKEGVVTYIATNEDAYGEAKNRYGVSEPILLDGTPKENFSYFCEVLKIDPKTLKDL